MPLLTAEQEHYAQVQDWACSIFTKQDGRKTKKLARAQVDEWPDADLPTTTLAQALEAPPIKRRCTHAWRVELRDSLAWMGSSAEGADLAAQFANAAILAHVPTSTVSGLTMAAKRSVGVWAAMRSAKICGSVAVRLTSAALLEYGRLEEKHVDASRRSLWREWLADVDKETVRQSTPGGSVERSDNATGTSVAGHADGNGKDNQPIAFGVDGLRPYQKDALDAVEEASPENCCVVLPCGAGKTKVGSSIAYKFLEQQPGGCVMVLCMRREGARQWAKELESAWCTASLEAIGKFPVDSLFDARIILVTYARMLSDHRRALRSEGGSGMDVSPQHAGPSVDSGGGSAARGAIAERFRAAPAGLLIADECHMVPAPRIGGLLKSLLGPKQRLIGLTATLLREGMPTSTEPQPVPCPAQHAEDAPHGQATCTLLPNTAGQSPWPILGECVYRQTFANLAPEYLAPIRCVEVRVPVLGAWRKLFRQKPLAPAMCLSRGKWEVLEHLLAAHAGESLLITVERCDQARLIASTFGILPLDGAVPAAEVQEYLERFRKRKITAIVATHVLDDSADFPELSVLIQMGGFFASRRQEQQRLGRLLRWGPVKRRRWEETGARPTFYVLVHQDTVEERMSRHRSGSVAGVEYERMTAEEIASHPHSPLCRSDLFSSGGVHDAASASRILKATVQAAAANVKRFEDICFDMSVRTAASMACADRKGSAKKGRASLQEIRAWLKGGALEAPGEAGSEPMSFSSGDEDSTGNASQGSSSPSSSSSSSSSSDSESSSTRGRRSPGDGAPGRSSAPARPAKAKGAPKKSAPKKRPTKDTALAQTKQPRRELLVQEVPGACSHAIASDAARPVGQGHIPSSMLAAVAASDTGAKASSSSTVYDAVRKRKGFARLIGGQSNSRQSPIDLD